MTDAVQETYPADMLRDQGADFLKVVAFFDSQIFRFAMILRDRRSTSYDLASPFVATALVWTDGIALARGRQLCAQLSISFRL